MDRGIGYTRFSLTPALSPGERMVQCISITPGPEFAQQPSANHQSDACCSFSLRERVRVRGNYSVDHAKRSISQGLLSIFGLIGGLALGFHACLVRSESVTLTSLADTTLIETEPGNNLGGAIIVNSGTTQNFTRNRGLFRFDFMGQIPPGSRITRADFVVEVTGQPKEEQNASSFGLHRVLKPWGEGDKTSPDPIHPGLGAPATAGEATWTHRFAFTTNIWAVPGGAATNDYVPELSSETFVYGLGDSPYTFVSTPRLVTDVQAWVDDPARNFGWMLISQSEELNFTARRFASREDTGREPYLVIEYAPPKIDSPTIANGRFTFSFAVQSNQNYIVEFLPSLLPSNNWSTVTNFVAQPASTNLIVSGPISGGQRFYRLRLP